MAETLVVSAGQSVGQGDWDALAAQHGGVKSSSKRAQTEAEIKAAAMAGDDDPAFQQRPIYRYNFADGSFVEARTASNGADYQVVDYKPSAKFTNDPANKPAPVPRSPDQQRSDAAAATTAETTATEATLEAAQRKKNRELPPDQDPRDETDAQRAIRSDARIKQQGIDARQAQIDARQQGIDAQHASTAASAERRAASQEARLAEESRRPDTKVDKRELGGQLYLVSTTVPKDGSAPTIRYYDPEGKQIAALPSEGAATATDFTMPHFVKGAAEQALREGHEKLEKDPRFTPVRRKEIFQEMVQTANIAIAESNAAELKRATEQREAESQRNTDYNIGTFSAKYLQDGATEALKFASSLKGTDLGGQVFGALLGLNLATLQAANLSRLTGKPQPPLPTITSGDMQSPEKIAAKRAEVDQHIATVTQPNAIGAGGVGNTPPAGATPSAPQPAAAPVGPASAVPPTSPAQAAANAGPVPGQDPNQWRPPTPPVVGVNPDAGQALGPTGDSPSLPAAPVASPSTYGKPGADPSYTGEPMPNPGGGVIPQPYDPANMPAQPDPRGPHLDQVPPGEVTMAPQSWQTMPAIASLVPPAPPAAIDPQQFADSPAMLHMQAKSTPPWAMTEDQYRRMMAAGVPEEDFWAVPGRVA